MQHKTTNSDVRAALAENIKQLCDGSAYTHEQISEGLGITSRQLTRYKQGLSEPRATTLYDLSEFFDVDIRRMFMTFNEWVDFINRA